MSTQTLSMIRCTGYDPNGIARVWGEHETSHDVAEARCHDEAAEYVLRRRDTLPLDGWTFSWNQPRRKPTSSRGAR